MESIDELRKRSRELQEKMFSLQRYEVEFRRIYGKLGYLQYRQNSIKTYRDEYVDQIKTLEKELQQAKRQLRQEHHIAPQTIDKVLRVYDSELSAVAREINGMELEPKKSVTDLYKEDMEQHHQINQEHGREWKNGYDKER